MRIGLNLLYLLPGVVGGTETYASGLLYGLVQLASEHEFIIYVNEESRFWPLPQEANISRIVCPVWATKRARRYIYEQIILPRVLLRHRVDIIHSLGYVSPLRVACPAVVTIHDLNYRAFGKSMPTVRRVALDFFVRKSALRAKHVMTGSHFARQQIIDGLGLPPGKVSVAYNAVTVRKRGGGVAENNEVVRMKYNFARPYIIAFGSGSPHKNIPRLLEAFAYVRACYRLKYQMVIVGHAMRYAQEIPWAMRDAVRFVGYMSDADLACILRGAEMLVYPSLYEGFGLPVLEAMAAGVPVVCSNVAALPEVGGDAAVYFNPCSVQDMGEKMMRVAQDRSLRQEMRERGYENVKRFSWEATAKATMAVYEYLGRLRD